jgi:NTP pyrophosphatase (non-canonical NTP hydrolase)
MKTIGEWQEQAHALAVEKGFHEGKDPFSPTRIGERLAQIHGEISEALECVKSGRMELYWKDPLGNTLPDAWRTDRNASTFSKPEGFGIELADVFLRACDFAESINILLDTPEPSLHWAIGSEPEAIADALNELHTSLSAVRWTVPDEHPIDGYTLSGFLQHVFLLAESQGIDLLTMAEIKHAYNKTRPIMHGGKKL